MKTDTKKAWATPILESIDMVDTSAKTAAQGEDNQACAGNAGTNANCS